MTPMESALWGTALALHAADVDGGLAFADTLVSKLRKLAGVRSHRPEAASISFASRAVPYFHLRAKLNLERHPRLSLGNINTKCDRPAPTIDGAPPAFGVARRGS